MGSEKGCHFFKALGIWAKLCHAKGTLVIAREFPIAVLGCSEARRFFHTPSLRLAVIHCLHALPKAVVKKTVDMTSVFCIHNIGGMLLIS